MPLFEAAEENFDNFSGSRKFIPAKLLFCLMHASNFLPRPPIFAHITYAVFWPREPQKAPCGVRHVFFAPHTARVTKLSRPGGKKLIEIISSQKIKPSWQFSFADLSLSRAKKLGL